MTPDKYTIDAKMKGKQYVYGGQVSVTHKITDYLAASVGLRTVYYDGYYRGHIITNVNQVGTELLNVQLDCDQTAWGFSPIIGFDFHMDRLTVAAKYEFRTKINTKNKTNELSANVAVPNVDMSALAPMLSAYQDGARTRYDMPAMLMVAVGYDFTDKFRATAEYHFFDDKNAKMANDRQKTLERGTHEFLIGAEYDINKTFTVSAGAQRTDYGLSDDYQTHTSFACDSYSVGLGGAANINEHLRLNVGYFWTMYSDYKKEVPAGNPGYCNTTMAGTDVFSRTNGVLGIGFDYKF
jgi:long-chain fatty acid transport protein